MHNSALLDTKKYIWTRLNNKNIRYKKTCMNSPLMQSFVMILLQIIDWLCENQMAFESFDQIQEFILGMSLFLYLLFWDG